MMLNLWVQATLDYASCNFLCRWPDAPDPARWAGARIASDIQIALAAVSYLA